MTNSVLFTCDVCSIECQCREHGGQLRSRVYTHLSSFLPCSKETLRKRVKKLKLAVSSLIEPNFFFFVWIKWQFFFFVLPGPRKAFQTWEIPCRSWRRPSGEPCPSRLHVSTNIVKNMSKSRPWGDRCSKNPSCLIHQLLSVLLTHNMVMLFFRTIEDGGIGNNVEEKGAKRGGGPKKVFKWNEEIRWWNKYP